MIENVNLIKIYTTSILVALWGYTKMVKITFSVLNKTLESNKGACTPQTVGYNVYITTFW